MKSTIKGLEIVITVGMNIGEMGISELSERQYHDIKENSHRDMGRHGKDIAVNAELKFGIGEMESETSPEEVKGLFDLISDAIHQEVRHQVEEQLEPVPQEEEDGLEVMEPPVIISDDEL